MTRRTPAQYNWGELKFDETILPISWDHAWAPQSSKIVKFIAIHHMASVGKGDGKVLDGIYNTWRTRPASAQYGVDGPLVRQYVWDKDRAFALANRTANSTSISIEHANSIGSPSWKVSEETMQTGARLVAYLHWVYKLGRPVSGKTLRQHDEFTRTACPGPYLGGTHWDEYVRLCQRAYDAITGVAPLPPQKPPPSTVKHYIVRSGDTLWSVARKFGTTVAKLTSWNRLSDADQIEVGQDLIVSDDSTAPTVPTYPASVLNLLNWKWTGPMGTKDHPVEVKQKALATYRDIKHFFVRGSGVVFQAPVNGVTTSGSSYPRSELREMKNNGTKNADWSNRSGIHSMLIDAAVIQLPGSKDPDDPRGVVAGQIHDAADDVVMLLFIGTKVYLSESLGKGKSKRHPLDTGYKLGTRFRFVLGCSDGEIRVYFHRPGILEPKRLTLDRPFSGGYFKAGCYTQANVKNGTGAGEVIIYKLDVKHGT